MFYIKLLNTILTSIFTGMTLFRESIRKDCNKACCPQYHPALFILVTFGSKEFAEQDHGIPSLIVLLSLGSKTLG